MTLADYCKERLREQIEQLAAMGAPSVSDVIEHDRKIVWPSANLQARVYNVAERSMRQRTRSR